MLFFCALVGLNYHIAFFTFLIQPTIYSTLKTWSLGPVHDPVSRGSEFNGFAGKRGFRFQCSGFSFFVLLS
jgi:hypothetical protein